MYSNLLVNIDVEAKAKELNVPVDALLAFQRACVDYIITGA